MVRPKIPACLLLSALLTVSALPGASALTGVSHWAEPEVLAAQKANLQPDVLAAKPATGNITREEFCAIALRLYETAKGAPVSPSTEKPFADTGSTEVSTAYQLGLVSGRGDGVFDPNGQITRQELCIMLDNVSRSANLTLASPDPEAALTFPDTHVVDDWAADAVEKMLEAGVIRGVAVTYADGSGEAAAQRVQLMPHGRTTREQALLLGLRFSESFAPAHTEAEPENPSLPEPEGPAPTPSDEEPYIPSSLPQTEEEKMAFVFGAGGSFFETPEIAESMMMEIAVPVWTLGADGGKTAGTKYLRVNRNLSAIVTAIFIEIHSGTEQFPIKNVGGYAWRSSPTSEHRWGTAIDINWEENFEARVEEDGSLTALTGTHWLPGEDPYSIPEDGDVHRAFSRYGFAWGGNAWATKRDFMHFSYFGR